MIDSGTSFDGYSIEGILGRGGMGVVYEATQISLGRKVALKVMRDDLARDPDFVRRFEREGRLQASLEHPNVLDVYEVGQAELGLFLAMRLVRGASLAELIRGRDLSANDSLRLLRQIAEALDAAHRAGLIHRDVKPQNVLVSGDGTAYLSDFGLTQGGGSSSSSASAQMVGTMAYVAPEVVSGHAPGPDADRYAFAAAMFHCLTGDVVFPMGSDAAILYAHAAQPPPAASERRSDLPAQLDQVFAAGLAKDPGERPRTAVALVDLAEQALGASLGTLGPPDPAVQEHSLMTLSSPLAKTGDAPRRSGRNRLAGMAALVAVAALGVTSGALLAGDGDEAAGADEQVPAVSDGTIALGSDLGAPDEVVGCAGPDPDPAITCAIAQADLPGRSLLVPSDGTINGWAVRGVVGEVALNVVRPRGDETVRISRSQWEVSSDESPISFESRMEVEKGDILAVELGRGSSIGVRSTDGAATQTWLDPIGGFYGAPDIAPGDGAGSEILMRADFEAGGVISPPPTLTGSRAARARVGSTREQETVRSEGPDGPLSIKLVEVGERVALDVFSDGRRGARMFIAGLIAGGTPVELEALPVDGSPSAAVGVWWVNPNSGRSIYQGFDAGARQIDPVG